MQIRTTGKAALLHLLSVAMTAGHVQLAKELQRIGLIEVRPCAHTTVADHLYVQVINQQLSLKAADAIWGRVLACARHKGLSPSQIFGGGFEEDLRACGVSGRKIKSLHAIRAADLTGALDRHELCAMAHGARISRLGSIWGIGKWTADMIGIFHFLDPDIWPNGDVAAVGCFRRLTGHDDTVLSCEPFAPYRSYLARYMWLIRDKPVSTKSGAA